MSTDIAVTPLRQRMIEDMAARNLGRESQRNHIGSCKRFAVWLGRSPDTATADDVRLFQLHLIESGASIPVSRSDLVPWPRTTPCRGAVRRPMRAACRQPGEHSRGSPCTECGILRARTMPGAPPCLRFCTEQISPGDERAGRDAQRPSRRGATSRSHRARWNMTVVCRCMDY